MNCKVIKFFMLAMVVFGCDQMNQLKEMHNNTAEMNRSTKEMNESTKKMDQSTATLVESMTEMKNAMKDMLQTMRGMDTNMVGMNTTMQGMDNKMGTMNTNMQGMDGKLGTTITVMQGMDDKLAATITAMKGMDDKLGATISAMKEMDSKLGVMSGVMKTMDDKMRLLTDKMSEMYESARTGIAKFLRTSAKDQLEKAASTVGKLSAAAVYNEAFEVQLWTGKGEDTEQKRLQLADEAVQEFYREIHNYLPTDLNDIDTLSSESKQQNLNTLAVTMSLTFSKQTEVLGALAKETPARQFPKMTLFTLTEAALRAKGDLKSGTKTLADLPSYIRSAVVFEKEAIFMMKTRMNFLVVMSLVQLSPIEEKWAGLPMGYLKSRLLGWAPDFKDLNAMQVSEAARYLKLALDTQKLLKDIGEDNRLQSKISDFIRSIQPPQSVSGSAEAKAKSEEIISNLARLLNP